MATVTEIQSRIAALEVDLAAARRELHEATIAESSVRIGDIYCSVRRRFAKPDIVERGQVTKFRKRRFGTEILGWCERLGRHIVSWGCQPQHNPHHFWISSTCNTNHIDQPTLWMPLPAAPYALASTGEQPECGEACYCAYLKSRDDFIVSRGLWAEFVACLAQTDAGGLSSTGTEEER